MPRSLREGACAIVLPCFDVNTGIAAARAGDLRAGLSQLPFLRYAREQLISRQIEAHLARQKLDFEERFEIGSHLALMAMVARRLGWAITTPILLGLVAGRFGDRVFGTGIMLTAAGIILGAAIGFHAAWRWMHRQ